MSVLYRVLSDSVPVAWQPSWDLLKKGLPYGYGEMRQIDYLTAVLEGRMQLWALIEQDKAKCAALTEIVEYPSEQKIVRIVLLGGSDINMLWKALPEFEFWAESVGAYAIEAWTRPGIAKAAKGFGFSHEKHVIAKIIRKVH